MPKLIKFLFILSLLLSVKTLHAIEYPGIPPGTAHCSLTEDRAILVNKAIRGKWQIESGHIASFSLKNMQTGQLLTFGSGGLPRIVLSDGRAIELASLSPYNWHLETNNIRASFRDDISGLEMGWSLTLDNGSNAIIQSLEIRALQDVKVGKIVFIETHLASARQIGNVDGSVVVCDNLFMAVEHPLAKNTVITDGQVSCMLPRGNTLKAGQSWTYTSVFGAVPPDQLRRGFLYYLEHRRAHPYRPFLHYNNWYNVYLARPVERTNEAECLVTMDFFIRKLIRERGVKMDAFVWDDGWDDFNSLWNFHGGFPEGFKKLRTEGNKYGVAQGVWMSPWGGYGPAKQKRIAYGKSHGYETNANGFSMAGARYGKAFREVCLDMMRNQGVKFFKFDGMGGGNYATGVPAEMADDIDAILHLTGTLRNENPDVFISATIGTWASPFWLLYVSSIWRQGGDNGFYGQGNTRQQWITYRDKFTYERIVKLGPLYPLNSLMLGGIIVGDRRAPANIALDRQSLDDEIWSFFGSGTCLQELYINPELLTDPMWDDLAEAAKWSRENSNVLVDTHWMGGDPANAEVYGWASWHPGKGIIVLRNPSESSQEITFTPGKALELPEDAKGKMIPAVIYPQGRKLPSGVFRSGDSLTLSLNPFEVVVMELSGI